MVVEKLGKVWFVTREYLTCSYIFSWKSKLLKFELLYPLNHIHCFNKICRICCVNSHVHSLKVWPKSVLPLLKYRIFARDCFYWHTLYSSVQTFMRLAAILEHDDTTVRRQRSCTIKLHTVKNHHQTNGEIKLFMDISTA